MYRDFIERNELFNTIIDNEWKFDIPGFICLEDLLYIIENEYIIPKNALLNEKTLMDADNYYVQAGDLRNINKLIKILR